MAEEKLREKGDREKRFFLGASENRKRSRVYFMAGRGSQATIVVR